MHHARVTSMTSEDQDHDHDYSDNSSNEASQEHGSPAKRRRVSQSWVNVSCQLCKTRKVKCDRTLPSCGWCSRNNAACEYKERKKPGLRAGYGRELEQRLDKLESILLQHSEVLARVLGQVPTAEERLWNEGERTNYATKHPCAFPHRQSETSMAPAPMNGLYEPSHTMRDSINVTYSPGQHRREFAPALPPISTAPPSHDRRPSVTFMNNPISPPPIHVKPSASQSPPAFTHGVLHQYAPLLTPNTTTSSGAHSPQHDYISTQKERREHVATPPSTAKALQERYPFNTSLSSYINEPLPPWPVMYELAVLYFTHINALLPLVSESTVFSAVLDPVTTFSASNPSSTGVKAILMALTVVSMRLLHHSSARAADLSEEQKRDRIERSKAALADPNMSKTKEGVKALAILLLGSNGRMGKEETQDILGQVTDRLWGLENGKEKEKEKEREQRKAQSPLSVSEMLCGS